MLFETAGQDVCRQTTVTIVLVTAEGFLPGEQARTESLEMFFLPPSIGPLPSISDAENSASVYQC